MKTVNSFNELPFRKPVGCEVMCISRWFDAYNKSRISFRSKLSWILSVGGICMCGMISTSYPDSALFLMVLAAVLFISAFFCVKSKNDIKQVDLNISQGKFLVISGRVAEICSGGKADCVSVRFLSDGHLSDLGWFRVRYENVSIGTPLLLVYMKKSKVKETVCRAFTPFMMSDYGIGLDI